MFFRPYFSLMKCFKEGFQSEAGGEHQRIQVSLRISVAISMALHETSKNAFGKSEC